MAHDCPNRILTLNSGSSSLKFSVYDMAQTESLAFSGQFERIGLKGGRVNIVDGDGQTVLDEHLDLPDHDAALKRLFQWLDGHASDRRLDAVGHRVVHGGPEYDRPHAIDAEVVARLRQFIPLAPDHLPHELKAIQAVSRSYPDLAQVACFDTAFHRTMPRVAQIYALPRHWQEEGVTRYGFHGLSYEYIVQELRGLAGLSAADRRIIIAHLGNGASMAAVRHGHSVETTMGFTPTGGLVMGTRSGDLDPGVVLYLLEEKGMRPGTVNDMLNQHAGLVGASGISSDMKDLLDREDTNAHAAQAIALFCYQARTFLGGLIAVLGGLDTLVFTAGIGENAPSIRWRICQNLEYAGIRLDRARNDANAAVISGDGSPVTVRVMATNEELMIARHTRDLVCRGKE